MPACSPARGCCAVATRSPTWSARCATRSTTTCVAPARARRRPFPPTSFELAARGGGGGRGDPHAALEAAELYGALAALPADQREAIALVDVAGLSYKEAARVLRVPPGTIMSRLSRGGPAWWMR